MLLLFALLIQRASHVALVVRNLPANAGDIQRHEFNPWVRRTPGEGHGKPFRYCCLETPTGRGASQSIESQRVGHNNLLIQKCKNIYTVQLCYSDAVLLSRKHNINILDFLYQQPGKLGIVYILIVHIYCNCTKCYKWQSKISFTYEEGVITSWL